MVRLKRVVLVLGVVVGIVGGWTTASASLITHRVTGDYQLESDYFNIFPETNGSFEAVMSFPDDTPDSYSPTNIGMYSWGTPPNYSLTLRLTAGSDTTFISSVASTRGRGYVYDRNSSYDIVEYQAFDAFDVDGTVYSFTNIGPGGDLTRFFIRFIDFTLTGVVDDSFPLAPIDGMSLSSGGSIFQLRNGTSSRESRVRFTDATTWEVVSSPDPPVVPEPSTLAIWFLLGTLGLTFGWWRRGVSRLA
jgi:hypothetical protein